jgi:hypothetical protein
MRHDQDAAVAAATVADEARSALLADLMGQVAECFPRRETRQCCGQMVRGLLMELEDHNCWTIAEAVGNRGPHRARQRPALAVGPAGPPVRELPGPGAAAAEPAVLQAPIAHAGPTANGTNGFGHPPPMLFGRVTDATGAPIWAASITIIDADGHQLMRTSTDRSGRYAVDSLPGNILTVLLSPPGRMPLAAPRHAHQRPPRPAGLRPTRPNVRGT